MSDEIHAAEFVHGRNQKLAPTSRMEILREALELQANIPDLSIINVLLDKTNKPVGTDVFDFAWKCLITRFHNTISYKNFPVPQNPKDYGLLLVDQTHEKRLRTLMRRIRKFNPIPSAYIQGQSLQVPLGTLAEDAVHRDSRYSYLVQLADINAYFLVQKHAPCKPIRHRRAQDYFDILDPVLCKKASPRDPQGIVRL